MKTVLLSEVAGMPVEVALLIGLILIVTGLFWVGATIKSERKVWKHKDGTKFNLKKFQDEAEKEVMDELYPN